MSTTKKIIKCENCEKKATYGFITNYKIIKKKCKIHKIKGMIGKLKPWYKRVKEFTERLTLELDCEMIENENIFIKGSKKFSGLYKPKIKHKICGRIFTNTTILGLMNSGSIGCGCTTNIPWYKRTEEFNQKLKTLNCELDENIKIFVKGTKDFKQYYKPKIKHKLCNRIFRNTTLHHLMNNNTIGCGCTTHISWYKRTKEFTKKLKTLNCELDESIKIFVQGTKNFGQNYKPKIKHIICGKTFNTTRINDLIHYGNIGCECNKKIPWYKRTEEFIEKLKILNCELDENINIFIRGTKDFGDRYKPKIKHIICW